MRINMPLSGCEWNSVLIYDISWQRMNLWLDETTQIAECSCIVDLRPRSGGGRPHSDRNCEYRQSYRSHTNFRRTLLLTTFICWHEPFVCRLSVCLSVMFVCLAHHLIAQGLGQFFLLKFLEKVPRGSRWRWSCKLNGRRYEKLAFLDQYLAILRKR